MANTIYKNSSVAARVYNKKWLYNFWEWLVDGWGWMSESQQLQSKTIIAQSKTAPDCGQAMAPEIIRAALNTIANSPEFPFKRIQRGVFVFVDYDKNGNWSK